jgi:hypothetical protein
MEIIYDCFQHFGNIIDPEQFWTLKNLAGVDIKEIAHMKGFPEDWLEFENVNITNEDDDIDENKPLANDTCLINHIFPKYLGKDKFGNKIVENN